MEKDEEKILEDLNEMFATKGWKHLTELAQAEANKCYVKALDQAKEIYDVAYAKGQKDIYLWLYNFKTLVEEQYRESEENEGNPLEDNS